MKTWIYVTILFLSSLSSAETVLVRAPSSSPFAYELFLKQKPQFISYVEYQHRKLQTQGKQEEKIFALADSFQSSPELTLMHLKGLQAEAPWTLMSLRFTRDLIEKSLPTANGNLRRELQSLYCKTAVLINEGPLATNCPTQYISLDILRKKFPKADKVLIETLGFSLADPANPVIAAQMRYHWTFLSNSGKAVTFYGTYEQLFQQSFTFADSVNGTCEGFTTDFDDLTVQSSSQVYFSDTCLKGSALPEGSKTSWIKEDRTWWVAAGLVVLGGLAYSLKDKKVSITAPGLKF
ncbi:hypothetical protein AZI86_03405 [Bdellovibrio bacteriovorus]|uniref:Uncharacterized protein n=1 Tax=Bdellovibrio bacteriovorus TaxID=959 RepID=A0A150WNN8_BDEBC|nr:hypothetical protein [Bdellovibrio bacteriovorus]KYG66123.1 hypothetical protein AZI86_03405 [Bdellovibrio bacteriovorus]